MFFVYAKRDDLSIDPGVDSPPKISRSKEVHSLGIVHGDTPKFNIFITTDGPKFIDLEDSIINSPEGEKPPGFAALKGNEIKSLEAKLRDESGRGRPWTINDAQ